MTAILDGPTHLTTDQTFERVHAMARSSADHPALKHPFYELWMSRALDADAVELVAKNYFARVQRTPIRIALAFLHMADVSTRAETVDNLFDEMGHGSAAKVHSVILRGFLETLLSRLRGHGVSLDEVRAPILPSTTRLIEESERLFSSPHPQKVCGALMAQEWHAYPQLVYMYEGVRNYRHLFGLEEFHENCEYFYLHIGATEKEHKVHSLSTAAKSCSSEQDVAQLEEGFTGYLDLLAANWTEIHEAIAAL
ncbi:iron-containing redox enzyme family protein [Actinospica robiniae]|uniref:iron-containing redox enzyme family protein n=1 Tax=Actinospica robiniae TaxID=304901 RepID=UPI000426CE47|nr:iron-containing redox enzyme family protein [Actinospica robiniae]